MQTKFPDYSKAEWLAKVEKDLKGKPMDGLNWEVEGEVYSPFWHANDLAEKPASIKSSGICQLGVKIDVNDPKEANQLALTALSGGANFLYFFDIDDSHKSEDYRDTLYAGILTDIVEVVWHNSPKPFLSYTLDNVEKELLMFSVLPERPRILWMELSGNYFQDIATLRAVRLCANLIAKTYDVTPLFKIGVIVKGDAADPNTAKIRSTAHAMAAMTGGADILMIEPADGDGDNTFERRIARNIHNLLQEESHLNQVADPAAGSYYIENLTNTIAEKIWTKFQQLSNDG
jgi:hypothetical protein